MKLKYFILIIGILTGLFGLGAFEQAPMYSNQGVGLMLISVITMAVAILIPNNYYARFRF